MRNIIYRMKLIKNIEHSFVVGNIGRFVDLDTYNKMSFKILFYLFRISPSDEYIFHPTNLEHNSLHLSLS